MPIIGNNLLQIRQKWDLAVGRGHTQRTRTVLRACTAQAFWWWCYYAIHKFSCTSYTTSV